jgi:hypothetical protein
MLVVKSKPLFVFCAIVLISVAAAFGPAARLFSFAYHTGEQSYILLIPVLVAGLIYRDRTRIFARASSGFNVAAGDGFAAGLALIALAYTSAAGSNGNWRPRAWVWRRCG